MSENEKPSLPDIVGVTSAVIVLDLLVRKINEFAIPAIDPHVRALAGKTELGLFLSHHTLGVWHVVMLVVFGVAALFFHPGGQLGGRSLLLPRRAPTAAR